MEFKKGDRVRHQHQGEGVVVQITHPPTNRGPLMHVDYERHKGWRSFGEMLTLVSSGAGFCAGDTVRIDREPTPEEVAEDRYRGWPKVKQYMVGNTFVLDKEDVNSNNVPAGVTCVGGWYFPADSVSLVSRAGEGAKDPEGKAKESTPEKEPERHVDGLPIYTYTAVLQAPKGNELHMREPGPEWTKESVKDYRDCFKPFEYSSRVGDEVLFKLKGSIEYEVNHVEGAAWIDEMPRVHKDLRCLELTKWKRIEKTEAVTEVGVYEPRYPVIAEFLK